MAARIASSLHAEPVVIEPRAMTPKRRERILAKHNGCCAYPECTETVGLELDHTIPLALGGRDADENLRPLCGPHHKAKTALDVKLIAKAKRLNATHKGLKPPPTRKLQGQGFRRRWGDLSHD
jgi:5-methylcytosine-specific restriction endonuclease McrA